MQHAIVVAIVVAFGSACVALLISRNVRPETAARAITLLAAISAVATLWTLAIVAGANIVQLHGIAERLSWCSEFPAAHRGTITPVGWAAIVGIVAGVYSTLRVLRRQRGLRAPAGHDELSIVASEVPTAFALPGRPGQIVISTGMLRSLDPDERRVLLAHERAHLRCHHHRYVRLTQLAAAAVPLLSPLNARVRFATERWADEEAVREVRDRTVVARAIARAALAQTDAVGVALGIADTGVVQRLESLLTDSPRPSRFVELGLAGTIALATGGLVLSVALMEPLVARLFGFCH